MGKIKSIDNFVEDVHSGDLVRIFSSENLYLTGFYKGKFYEGHTFSNVNNQVGPTIMRIDIDKKEVYCPTSETFPNGISKPIKGYEILRRNKKIKSN
ncbi:MAG: hypothetical protein WCX73_05700 [Candidatus Pacearchaeota archaeon]|jgi:hypothetical protein